MVQWVEGQFYWVFQNPYSGLWRSLYHLQQGASVFGIPLSMSMREGETLKAYSDRYWEMFNEIKGKNDDVAISTFKAGLPTDHDLRKSLIGKPVTSVHQLMDRIDKYRRVEEDQLQGKGKAKVVPQERRDFRSDCYNNNRPRRDFVGQSGSANTQTVNTVFREPVQ